MKKERKLLKGRKDGKKVGRKKEKKEQGKTGRSSGSGLLAQDFNLSNWFSRGSRCVSDKKPAWPTEKVQGQSELPTETHSQTTKMSTEPHYQRSVCRT